MIHSNNAALFAALLAAACAAACAGGNSDPRPDLEVTPAEANMCEKAVGETFSWPGLQLANTGDATLAVSGMVVRGDSDCAFRCYREADEGEDPSVLHAVPQEGEDAPALSWTIGPGEIRFVRVDYTPVAPDATSHAALVITSDARSAVAEGATTGQTVVPLCGTGLDPEDIPDAGVDAGSSMDAGLDCPVCEAPTAGSPGCPGGYPEI